jgi:hypothetical protein
VFRVYVVQEKAEAGCIKTLKISVTVYQQTQNVLILINWKRTSTAHDMYPIRADRDPSVLSCHVIKIVLF